jgi:hypothetical protein
MAMGGPLMGSFPGSKMMVTFEKEAIKSTRLFWMQHMRSNPGAIDNASTHDQIRRIEPCIDIQSGTCRWFCKRPD